MKVQFLILSVALMVSACGKGGGTSVQSVRSDGTCSSRFIADYNFLVRELKGIKGKTQVQVSVLKSIDSACDSFIGKHGKVSGCSAENLETHDEVSINGKEFDEVCGKIKEALKDH